MPAILAEHPQGFDFAKIYAVREASFYRFKNKFSFPTQMIHLRDFQRGKGYLVEQWRHKPHGIFITLDHAIYYTDNQIYQAGFRLFVFG
jgi:hypothetical protein